MFKKLLVLIITAFVDMVGLLMVIPLMPFYARKMGAGSMVVTIMVVSFTAAQLVSAPLWGRFSDKYGRRPALLVGLGAAAMGYVVFAVADSIWLLLLSRLVQGAGGGTVGVIQAYVADATEPENRAKALGWLSAATNVGVALGPPLGSLALLAGHGGPGLLAAGLCLINMVFAWKYLGESRDMDDARTSTRKPNASREALLRVISHAKEPGPRLIWIYAIAMGSFSAVTAILPLFLADQFGIGEKKVWIFFTYIGIISVITRAGVLGWAVTKYGEAKLARIGLALLAAGLASYPFVHNYVLLALGIALVPLGTAFTFPCVTSLLSKVIPANERGLYMGVQQTYGGLSRVIIPLWAGFSYDHFGRAVPFLTSATLVLCSLFLVLGVDDGRNTKAAPIVEGVAA
ncbi:MAG: MFS transporter [Gemmatimonadaceae bacterium]